MAWCNVIPASFSGLIIPFCSHAGLVALPPDLWLVPAPGPMHTCRSLYLKCSSQIFASFWSGLCAQVPLGEVFYDCLPSSASALMFLYSTYQYLKCYCIYFFLNSAPSLPTFIPTEMQTPGRLCIVYYSFATLGVLSGMSEVLTKYLWTEWTHKSPHIVFQVRIC